MYLDVSRAVCPLCPEPALRLWQGEARAEAAGDLLRHLGPVLRETGRQVTRVISRGHQF